MLNWLSIFFLQEIDVVRYNLAVCKWKQVRVGPSHGAVAGPNLFNIYICGLCIILIYHIKRYKLPIIANSGATIIYTTLLVSSTW